MISFYRTASVQPGKMADAIAHAKAIAEHLKKAHGWDVSVSVPFGGTIGRIQWRSELKDMAELEARILKRNADPRMAEFGKNAAIVFLPGVEDSMWRSV
jgi:hypothetical protein